MKVLFLIFYLSIILPDSYLYKIKFLGIKVADCNVTYSDTVLYEKDFKKIEYKVSTNSFIDNFFKVNNNYIIIIDDNYNTVYFKKDTSQPNLKNQIETEYQNGFLKYKNSNIVLDKNNKNIFSILYMIYKQDYDILNKIKIIEREGKYYNFNSEINQNKIDIFLDEIDDNNNGLVKHTDIFTWGLFLDKTKKTIIYNKDKKYIEKCIFKKGITTITANLDRN